MARIVVDGGEETNDFILLPDRVVRNWCRQDGHALGRDDLGRDPRRSPFPLGRRLIRIR
jgi:hypothetical protein